MTLPLPKEITGSAPEEVREEFKNYVLSTDLPSRAKDIKDKLDNIITDAEQLYLDLVDIGTSEDKGILFRKAMIDLGESEFSPVLNLYPVEYIELTKKEMLDKIERLTVLMDKITK
ncbi:MAG: hypothetical protein SO148_01050 [Candidatus Onthovivens sp.]|nr:hypothetical protein [Candidatus Onthovivens sp.]